VDGAVIGEQAFVLRFFGAAGDDRLLLINLGADLPLDIAPEPLLAPPEERLWATLWSSESADYGGCGTPPPDGPDGWRLPAESAIAMRPDGVNPWT
jgi:maltooligosyltrehalose trehalohydrolase